MAIYAALDRVTLVKNVGDDNVRMRIISHDALDMMRQGKATRQHMDAIVNVSNMAETLAVLYSLGRDWLPEIREAQAGIKALAERGAKMRRYVLKAEELNALNLLMQIHDSQLDACTVQMLGEATDFIRAKMEANEVLIIPSIKDTQ